LLGFRKKEDKIEDSEKQEITSEINDKPINIGKSDNRVDKLEIEIERLKAILSTSNEYKKANEERLTRISESIGELRSSMIEREKQVKDLEISALKSADLVKEVQPEKLMLEVKKTESKASVLQGKLESYDTLISNIIDEIKAIRKLTAEFEGTESIKEMNQEVRSELGEIKRRESKIEIESNKVTRIFEEIQKRYNEQQEIKSLLNQTIINDTELKKELDSIKIKLSNLLDKDELIKVKSEIKELLAESGLKKYKEQTGVERAINKLRFPRKEEQEDNNNHLEPPLPEPRITISNENIDSEIERKFSILNNKTEREISQAKSSFDKFRYELTKDLEDKLGNLKSRIKESEISFHGLKQDPNNPLYQRLKQEMTSKVSYYDSFISDTAVKIPIIEKELSALKSYLKAVISKNQEIINHIKSREIMNINPKTFAKSESLERVKDVLLASDSQIKEVNENFHASITELKNQMYQLKYELNEKAEKSLSLGSNQSSQETILYDLNKKVRDIISILNAKADSSSVEEKLSASKDELLYEMNKKIRDVRLDSIEKVQGISNAQLKPVIQELNSRLNSLALGLEEKADRSSIEEKVSSARNKVMYEMNQKIQENNSKIIDRSGQRISEEKIYSTIDGLNEKINKITLILEEKANKSSIEEKFSKTKKELLYDLDKKIQDAPQKVIEKPVQSVPDDRIYSLIRELNTKINRISSVLEEKENKSETKELKESISSLSHKNEASLLELKNQRVNYSDGLNQEEINRIKDDLMKIKRVLNTLIKRDEEWMNAAFKTIKR